MKNGKYTFYNPAGFTDKSVKELSHEFEKMGFEYQSGEFGGGISAQQIIAWLNIHNFWAGIFTGLAVNRIETIMGKIYDWFRSNRPAKKDVEYAINISVYEYKKSYTLTLKAGHKYTKNQIRKFIIQEKNKKSVLKKIFRK